MRRCRSSKTFVAVGKSTPCFARLDAALAGSHSNSIMETIDDGAARNEASIRPGRILPPLPPPPQDLGRAPRAFGHRREFGPADRLVADPRAEPAIGAGQHILAADEARVAHQPLGDEVGVLDKIAAMADDARNERRAIRQLYRLEDAP